MIHFSDWTKGLGKSGKEEKVSIKQKLVLISDTMSKWNKGRVDAVAGIPNVDPNNKW